MNGTDFNKLFAQLLPAVQEAGAAILRHRGSVPTEHKPDNSPVTEADREAERILLAALAKAAPEIPVISEEAGAVPSAVPGERFFLVDPLDGTKEFISGQDDFTVNIGLIDRTCPVFGIVFAPAKSLLFATTAPGTAVRAALSCGSPLPGELALTPIRGRQPPADGLVAAVSRSHLDGTTTAFLAERHIARTISAGSSLKFCLLAEGKADVYPRFGRTMEWDTAAGHAVLAAAGGTVLDADGKTLAYGKAWSGFDNPGFVAWAFAEGSN